MRVPPIVPNKARCRKCGDVIESRHRHDFVSCSCGAISLDGGQDYIRAIGNPDDFEMMGKKETPPTVSPPPTANEIAARIEGNTMLATRIQNLEAENARLLVQLAALRQHDADQRAALQEAEGELERLRADLARHVEAANQLGETVRRLREALGEACDLLDLAIDTPWVGSDAVHKRHITAVKIRIQGRARALRAAPAGE